MSTKTPRNIFLLILALTCFSTLAVGDENSGAYTVKHAEKDRPKADSDKALIYVLRPAFSGFAVKMWAYADDQFLGVTNGRNYIYAMVKPGAYIFWSKSENVNAIRMAVEAGKTYYIQQRVRPGAFRASTLLEVLDTDAAKKAFKKCKYVTPTERARTKANQYLAKNYPIAKKVASTYPQSKQGKSLHDYDTDEELD